MIALDTNVVVRFLTGDDPEQADLAAGVFAAATTATPVFLSCPVLVEAWWVLHRTYGNSEPAIAHAIERLCDDPTIVVESEAAVRSALQVTC